MNQIDPGEMADLLKRGRDPNSRVAVQLPSAARNAPLAVMPTSAETIIRIVPTNQIDPEEMADLLKRGRELVAAGNISAARLVLKRAAEAGNASAALELGATFDPIVLEELRTALKKPAPAVKPVRARVRDSNPDMAIAPDIPMARVWYQTAKDLGSAEASKRLERLSGRDR